MAAYADLGGLGPKQGPPTTIIWTLPNLIPVLLPWLVVLLLLALPANRGARAWWIWVPLGGLALIAVGLEALFTAAENEAAATVIQGLSSVAFGLTAVWLLGDWLGRRHRALAIPMAGLVFASASLLAFVVGPVFEEFSGLRQWVPAVFLYLLAFGFGAGLVVAGALHLSGWRCRRRFRRWRFALWLPLWLWVLWLAAGGLLAGIIVIDSGSGFEWLGYLMATVVFALVTYGMMLPFLILSFTCAFYRERLRVLLKVPEPAAEPTPAPPAAGPEISP